MVGLGAQAALVKQEKSFSKLDSAQTYYGPKHTNQMKAYANFCALPYL